MQFLEGMVEAEKLAIAWAVDESLYLAAVESYAKYVRKYPSAPYPSLSCPKVC